MVMTAQAQIAGNGQELKDPAFHWEDFRFVRNSPVQGATHDNRWDGAAPIGNGHLGARISGNPGAERIYFNLATYWKGGPWNDPKPEVKKALPKIRAAVAAKDYAKAEELQGAVMRGDRARPSLGLGWLDLKLLHGETFTDFYQSFDLDQALVETRYTVDGVTYTKRALCSHPDQVIALQLTASKEGALSFTVDMSGFADQYLSGTTVSGEGNDLVISGNASSDGKGMRFQCRLRAVAQGGKVAVNDKTLTVTGSTSVLLLLTGSTSYNGPFKDPGTEGVDEVAIAKGAMDQVASKSWEAILKDHVADHRKIFRRFYAEFNGRHEPVPGGKQKGSDAYSSQSHALIMQFGRYTMIAGSREDSKNPMSLQGMWSKKQWGPWQNAYHLNEPMQKFYHFAEASNIQETLDPLFRYIELLAKQGKEIAEVNYGARGWCAHHQSDIWGAAGIRAKSACASGWAFGGGWTAQALWRHYEFSRDVAFLKKYYPIIKGSAEFMLDWLIEGPDGKLITSPSTSPENTFSLTKDGPRFAVTYATTCDMTLIKQGLKECLWAAQVLGQDEELQKTIKATLPKLYPYKIGSQGQLLEWPEEWYPIRDDHRHASGLLGIWDGSEITMQHTPELFKAAKIALEFKGNTECKPGPGVMWARLRDGDMAVKTFNASYPQYWQPSVIPGAMPEMVLQSHAGEIDILPALPKCWPEGRVAGIRARGGFTLDIAWQASKPSKVTIRSTLGEEAVVRCPGAKTTVISGGKNIEAKRVSPDVISFKTEKNVEYVLTF
jgi:alpha-L-fucosidase 2